MTGQLAVDVSAVQGRSAKEVPIVTSSALMNISDPVPAITEAGATGEIAAIFADIRLVLGVDVVNLIWRHLATIPGALPWAWGTLPPLYADGSIAAEAAALHGDLDLPRLPSRMRNPARQQAVDNFACSVRSEATAHRRGTQPGAEARAAHGPETEIDRGAAGRSPPPPGRRCHAC